MGCVICGKDVGWLMGTKIDGGRLCRDCAGRLPSLFVQRGRGLQEYTLRYAMQKAQDNLDLFSATASYGELHIDEVHGLFCVARSLTADGRPVKGNNVFAVSDLTEVGITCTSPRETSNGVYVDVEFTCSLRDPDFRFVEIIKRNCRCKSRRAASKEVVWDVPSDLLVFQAMFNQMLTVVWERVNAMLCGQTVHELEMDRARTLFMLDEGYSEEELETAYARLRQVYGDSVAVRGNNQEMDIINKYYYLLRMSLERFNVE